MNCILFYPHECIADTTNLSINKTYRIHVCTHDIRAKHISTILSKVSEGKKLEAGIIDKGFGTATILSLNSHGIDICFHLEKALVPKWYKSTIVLAHPRPPVMARLLRDMSTMGIDNIICYVPELGEKSYLKASFWNKADELLLQGAMQGKECTIPYVYTTIGIENAVSMLNECKQKEHDPMHFVPVIIEQQSTLALHTFLQNELLHMSKLSSNTTAHSNKTVSTATAGNVPPVFHLIYFIGPERQYSNTEEKILESLQCCSAHLGQQTLRSEVATLIVQGMWNMLWRK